MPSEPSPHRDRPGRPRPTHADVEERDARIKELREECQRQRKLHTDAEVELAGRIARIAELKAEVERKQRCLNFFASVIKSGEPWTETCQREFDAAQGDDDAE